MRKLLFLLVTIFCVSTMVAQQANIEKLISNVHMRNIGPSFVSGRIADIAMHPQNESIWYVAVASGGVWKTENAGVTWTPVFDTQSVYATGCVTIDPSFPDTVWVGTGENVGGRHIAFGDGVYKSTDGGKSWKNMGLPKSEHISKIIVHPTNSDIVWVASQGPLWSSGGDRGLYKTTDGGNTWRKVLGGSEWTGATDIVMDPTNPDRLYAATWDRHRTVAAYMGGGPGSGIHISTDGGETWQKATNGLPKSNMGKIGLAISPQQPNVVYAAIELDRRSGGVYKSTNSGASWKKQSNAVSGATGPHYYQELYASPHAFDRLYLMDVRIQVSDDGGKTFRTLKEQKKHSDNHAIVFKKSDPNYLMVGTDAGIYETFDLAENWRFIPNLPLTQYYKVAVNYREPFYQVFGGTQDNGSHGGPSRTDNEHGIRNSDWFKTLGADGHQSAADYSNPDIMYAESQQGNLHRVDLKTGEQVFIQPQPREGEPYERFNWDAPIVISPHNPAHLYVASSRVWKSENRGDSWTAISGDLTRQLERLKQPIMGKQQSWDNPWDVFAMSNFSTITSLSESPKQAGLIYAGTDDGLLNVTEDGGTTWRKIEVSSMPGMPSRAFINDVKADLHDVNTVYVSLDNHKEGDYSPYIYKSTNKGKTWKSLKANLPSKTLVWRLVQDPIKKELLFLATEFGIYTSLDAGTSWHKLAGTPTISFRDLAIQSRENDLIGASFGRGFYILDDYSFLREITPEVLQQNAALFSTRKAWWYVPRTINGDNGANQYSADNPDFGAVFTYYVAEDFPTAKSTRKKAEKELLKQGKDVPFPGWGALEDEVNEPTSMLWFTIKDSEGNVVRNLTTPAKKGINRIAWDLRFVNPRPIDPARLRGGNSRWNRGPLVVPGTYTVEMAKEVNGKVTSLAGPVSFEVVPLHQPTLQGASSDEFLAFFKDLSALQTNASKNLAALSKNLAKVAAMKVAAERSSMPPGAIQEEITKLHKELLALDAQENGMKTKNEVGEVSDPGIMSFMRTAMRGLATTYGPTKMNQENLVIAQRMNDALAKKMENYTKNVIPALEKKLQAAGAPYIME